MNKILLNDYEIIYEYKFSVVKNDFFFIFIIAFHGVLVEKKIGLR